MAYQIFTQPQGPQISTSLFGDAATRGIAAGNALPTTATSIIKGAVEGYEKGQEIALRGVQLENAETVRDINKLKLEIDTKTQNLELEDQTAKLTNERDALNQTISSRNRQQEFETSYKTSDPTKQASMVLSGEYQDVFNNNPKLYESALKGVYLNPQNGLDASTRNNIGVMLRRSNAADPWAKEAQRRAGLFEQAQANILNDADVTGQVATKLGILPTEVPYKTKLLESGKYQKNEAGTALLKDGDGNFIPLPFSKQEQPAGKWDVITPDGTIIFPDAPKEIKSNYSKYIYENDFQQGKFAQTAANQATPRQQPQAVTTSRTQAQDTLQGRFQRTLKIDEPVFKKAEAPFNHLQSQIALYASEPSDSRTVTAQARLNRSVTTLARSITDAQFDSDPAIREQNSEAYVKSYNEKRIADLATSLSGFKSPYIPMETLEVFKVESPKDLYFAKQQTALEAQIGQFAYQEIKRIQNNEASKAKNILATKSKSQYLTAIANGAKP